jgi:hypothetical protein
MKEVNTMAKKNIAANAEKFGAVDASPKENAVKFVTKFKEKSIVMFKLDANGKRVEKRDAHGNGMTFEVVQYEFTKVPPHKNAEGKIDPNTAFSFLIVDPDIHGSDFQRLLDKCKEECKNPAHKMFTEEEYFKQRNPEAFRIAKDKAALESLVEESNSIEDLRKKLGLPVKANR